MSYSPLTIAGVRLTINGTDYSDELVSFDVSDDSFLSSTVLTTTGTIELAQSPFGVDVDDWIGTDFELAKQITLDIKQPNGSFSRHPRGRLFITGRNYNFETKIMELDVACSLGFYLNLEEDTDELAKDFITTFGDSTLKSYLEDDEEENIELLRNLLLAEGAAIYQDQFGNIQKIKIADSINYGKNATTVPYKFTVSDRDGLLSISPNNDAANPVETKGVLEYEVFGQKVDGNFIEYKTDAEYDSKNVAAVNGKCPPGGFGGTTTPNEDITKNIYQAEDPQYKYKVQQPGVTLSASTKFIQVEDTTTTKKTFRGPGRQISKEVVEQSSNRLMPRYASYYDNLTEYYRAANPNDKFYYQRALSELPPNFGVFNRKTTIYKYGTGGQLKEKRETNEEYGLFFNSPEDYTAQVSSGNPRFPQPFIFLTSQEVTTEYEYRTNYTEETVTTLDFKTYAKTGSQFKSIQIRRSGGNLANPRQQDYQPKTVKDNVCSPDNQETNTLEFTHKYGVKKEYTLSGSGISKTVNSLETVDFPLNFKAAKSRESAKLYAKPLRKFTYFEYVKTNSSRFGFQIQVPLLAEMYAYYPSYPFRLGLVSEGSYYNIAGNSVTWSVTQSEAVCSIDALVLSQFTGTPTLATPTYTQNFYTVPAPITPTTGNNTSTNQGTTLGTTVQTVSGSTATTVNVTTLPTITATGSAPLTPLGTTITFQNPLNLVITDPTGGPLNPAAAAVAINFSVPNTLTIGTSVINFGTILAPIGNSNFGTIGTPATLNLNAGTITVPTI